MRSRGFSRWNRFLLVTQLDGYAFEPCGNSFNAIKDDLYYTIHMTPEKGYSYVSIETNDCNEGNHVIHHFLNRLSPASFDVISFNMQEIFGIPSYECKSCFKEKTSIGYEVFFAHYFKRAVKAELPHYF